MCPEPRALAVPLAHTGARSVQKCPWEGVRRQAHRTGEDEEEQIALLPRKVGLRGARARGHRGDAVPPAVAKSPSTTAIASG
ncbi:MAG: hypothetical protein WCA77_04275 [Thermoplasmata archaeon]